MGRCYRGLDPFEDTESHSVYLIATSQGFPILELGGHGLVRSAHCTPTLAWCVQEPSLWVNPIVGAQ